MEEVELLTEEMQRVQRFFQWQHDEWTARGDASRWQEVPKERFEALRAYASRQAALYQALKERSASLWQDLPAHVTLMLTSIENPEILQHFKDTELDEEDGSDGKKRKRKRKRGQGNASGLPSHDIATSLD